MNRERVSSGVATDSTPWPWPAPAAGPRLVVCPLGVAGAWGAGPGLTAAAGEIYRLAYERALAAARPSRHALARAVFSN